MLKTFLKIAVPAMLTNLSSIITMIVSYTFAGHLDKTQLAALGLTFSVNNIMVVSLLIGLSSAQETLTSQAFGANDLHLCGVYLNRGFFIIMAFFIPLAVIPSMFAEKIFMAMG